MEKKHRENTLQENVQPAEIEVTLLTKQDSNLHVPKDSGIMPKNFAEKVWPE